MHFMRHHARDQGWANVIAALALAVALGVAGGVTWGSGHQFWGAVWFVLAGLSAVVGLWALLALLTDSPTPLEPRNRRETIKALYRLREADLAFVGYGTQAGFLVRLNLDPGGDSWQQHANQWTALYNELLAARIDFDAEADVVGEWFAKMAKAFSLECITHWERLLGHPLDDIRNKAIPQFFAAVDEILTMLNTPPAKD